MHPVVTFWFSIHYAAAAVCREIFDVNTQLASPNLQDTDISLILKNKMAAAGISLKIIYLFLLADSQK